jgi:adenylosuccinate lyase
MATKEQLLAVGPIDGRYADKVGPLQTITSEYGLIHRRVVVSAGWLSVLGSSGGEGVIPDMPPLAPDARQKLTRLGEQFTVEDALAIKDIEDTTKHDVNAAVRWLKLTLGNDPQFDAYKEFVHFGRTSEDVNNLAYAMVVRDARDSVLIPGMNAVEQDLRAKAGEYAEIPMLAHTHGQPAVPTTLGKEMAVFAERSKLSTAALGGIAIYGKLNGASGNYNADKFAYPEVDWEAVAEEFVRSLGFEFNPVTTQIEPHDWVVRFSNELSLSNSIMADLAQDMWLYIMKKYFKQRVIATEDGSSAMPQKVNPIDHENAESNFHGANDILQGLARRLPISRLQRDLSDSSSLRRIGEAFGHTVIAHKSIRRGLGKVYPNEEVISAELNEEWGILAEPLQTVMRQHGVEGAYDVVKEAVRGRGMTEADYLRIIAKQDLPKHARERLADLTPATYIGNAAIIAKRAAGK